MSIITFDVDQSGWGSSLVYADDNTFAPRYMVVHWGGGTGQIPADSEDDRLRIWQRYHRGWMTDIAYNYAVGDSGKVYRLRGMNSGGHVKCSVDHTPEGDSYCDASIGVVWVGGANDVDGPSDAAIASLNRMASESGLEVKAHRTVKQENGSSTACPGSKFLIPWIESKEWETSMPREQFTNLIKSLFKGRPEEFRGDPAYFYLTRAEWVAINGDIAGGLYDQPNDPDWPNFWNAFVRVIA